MQCSIANALSTCHVPWPAAYAFGRPIRLKMAEAARQEGAEKAGSTRLTPQALQA